MKKHFINFEEIKVSEIKLKCELTPEMIEDLNKYSYDSSYDWLEDWSKKIQKHKDFKKNFENFYNEMC